MDYQGNSNKAKEQAAKELEAVKEEDGEPKIQKVITGEVVVKKVPMSKKLKGLFFGDDFKSVIHYVGYEVLLPGAKDILYDMIIGSAQRSLYGARKHAPGVRQHPAMNSRVEYNNPKGNRWPPDPRHKGHRPDQPAQSVSRNRRETGDMVFGYREDAQQTLDTLVECINAYGLTTLADLYELTGLPVATVDHKWGWTDMHKASIRQVREGYSLELPPLEEI